jgi:SRSO17 transposase
MGRLISRSGDTVARLLQPAATSFEFTQSLCQSIFRKKRTLFIVIDDTLIKKIHSQFMQGSGRFFDTKIGRQIIAYRLVIVLISDGKIAIPIDCAYLFSKELLDEIKQEFPTKNEIARAFVTTALKLFPDKKMFILADGLYTTIEFLTWCKTEKLSAEMRMRSNCVVEFNGEKISLKKLLNKKGMKPKGRQMARTFSAKWHNLDLEFTIERRIDKHGDESFVFQVATYKALPREHVANYKKRWSVEMLNRTTKQELGLEECFSRSLQTQHNHVAAVLVAYALAQLEKQKHKLDNVEQAIRRLKTKSMGVLLMQFTQLNQVIDYFDA